MIEGFAMVPNWIVRDKSISLHALVVFVALASHSGKGGIHPSQKVLCAEARISESAVRRAIRELESIGVLETVQRKNSSGRATNGYLLHHQGPLGADEERIEVPVSGTGTNEVPVSGTGGTGQRVLSIPLIEEEPFKKNPDERFDEFWAVYPSHMAKADARKRFDLVVKKGVDPAVIIRGARRFRDDPNLPPLRFIPYPATWLNQGRWEDEALPPREDLPVDMQAESARLADEQERQAWEDLQYWLKRYGVSLEEWQKHHEEPGWVDEIEAPVKEAEYVERHRMLQEMGLVRGDR
jgi:hypothetical protein